MAFSKATKEQARLRAALFSPSGGGKTYSALRIATGIASVVGGRIAFIDTEHRTARKYSDRFDFDVDELESKRIEDYIAKIGEASKLQATHSVLIIDSLSHAWQELLAEVDQIAAAKFRGNNFSAWSKATPKQRSLIEAILRCPLHVIVTMRSKTEWLEEKDDRGKVRPVKIGLAPEQGKGIEYEFDLLMELSTDHVAVISKDRTGLFQDKTIDKPDEKFGADMARWLMDGTPAVPVVPVAAPPVSAPATAANVAEMKSLTGHLPDEVIAKWFTKAGVETWEDMSDEAIVKCIAYTKKLAAEPVAA